MNPLKFIIKFKCAKNCSGKTEALINWVPQFRYFQYVHDLPGEPVPLKIYMANVDEKLGRLMALLNRPPEHAL